MRRLYVIAEGQTEVQFINGPLAEALAPMGLLLRGIELGVRGKKGGNTNYDRVRGDLVRTLKQDRSAYCSTMIDFYGLGSGFPGTPVPSTLTSIEKVERIENAVKKDVLNRIPDYRPDLRLIPYLSLHEYEALLFSDPGAFAEGLGQPALEKSFRAIRSAFLTPEEINNNPERAPSKRVLAIYRPYQKVIDGLNAARKVTVRRMRQECPHFRQWLDTLEALPDL